jgi:RNA polymerase sigma factor (sigma-70 family)
MSETPTTGGNSGNPRRRGAAVTDTVVSDWFIREILPLEAILMHYLHHNWQNNSDIADLRQEVYVRVFEAANTGIPDNPKRFLLATARNLLIDLVRHERVVPIEAVGDLESLGVAIDAAGPDRVTMAREELRRLQAALDRLPPRSREAVVLAYIEGLSGQEIAARMGVTPSTVSEHLANGIRTLTDVLYGEFADRGKNGKKP